MGFLRRYDNIMTLATTIETITSKKADAMLKDIEAQIQLGWITHFFVLCSGRPTSIVRSKIESAVKRTKHKWVLKHLLFRLKEETVTDFVKRICIDYDVTNFVSMNKFPLQVIATEPNFTNIKVSRFNPTVDEWNKIRSWLINTCPTCYSLRKKAKDGFQIIKTGITLGAK